jgi:hypothetical protein
MRMMNLFLLPGSITRLELKGLNNSTFVTAKLQQLARLLHLKLAYCAIKASVLSSFPRLQTLCLKHCTLLGPSSGSPGAQGCGGIVQSDVDGTAALLEVMGQLTNLQHLQLHLERLDTGNTAPCLLSALTASSGLTELTLAPHNRTPLPKVAVRYMLPTGRQLPLLQRLTISPSCDHIGANWPGGQWCVSDKDIQRIASGCPALQSLDIALAVEPFANLSGLLQLPQSCTALVVGGAAFADSAAATVKQLTQVQNLCWHRSPRFTDAGLEQLVEMRRLDHLYVDGCGLSDAISDVSVLCLDADERKVRICEVGGESGGGSCGEGGGGGGLGPWGAGWRGGGLH